MNVKNYNTILSCLFLVFVACTLKTRFSESATEKCIYKFDFGNGKTARGYTQVLPENIYIDQTGFGFINDSLLAPVRAVKRKGPDILRSDFCTSDSPFYFAVNLSEGNYRVTIITGDQEEQTANTVKAELRRLMIENAVTSTGEFREESFLVNTRTPVISTGGEVKLKEREKDYEFWAWDDMLTLEFNGSRPAICAMEIVPVRNTVVIYLLGNSTVCDQPLEPYSSWGQMLTRFFKPEVVIANHGESGETYRSSFSRGRVAKIMSLIKPGDYLFLQFGHNDMKQKGDEFGAFLNFRDEMNQCIQETRKRGGIPVLITPVQRRNFDENARVANSHGDYPESVRQTAAEFDVPLIDLHEMSARLYEAFGPDSSVILFSKPEDGTHHNNYGSYQLAKCIVQGIKDKQLKIARYIIDDFMEYDPATPDPFDAWNFPASPAVTHVQPDGS